MHWLGPKSFSKGQILLKNHLLHAQHRSVCECQCCCLQRSGKLLAGQQSMRRTLAASRRVRKKDPYGGKRCGADPNGLWLEIWKITRLESTHIRIRITFSISATLCTVIGDQCLICMPTWLEPNPDQCRPASSALNPIRSNSQPLILHHNRITSNAAEFL